MKKTREKKTLLDETRQLLKESQISRKKYWIRILGKRFVTYPNVFSPKFFNSTEFFSKEIPINKGEKFLEMGSGSGVISVFALIKGASSVLSIDINSSAVKNTKENLKFHGFRNKSKVYNGDLFSPIKNNEKFDTIFWAMPFGFINENNLGNLEESVFDPNYKSIRKFIKDSKIHLKRSGKLLIGFSTTLGHYGLLEKILKDNGFRFKIIKEHLIKEKRIVKFQIIKAFLE
jgi:methylase of polypeptide subunit release factors|tara:strand:- start:311 stop:1003 length:693 start_codon:yes stop_codon:yes gene_type:complete